MQVVCSSFSVTTCRGLTPCGILVLSKQEGEELHMESYSIYDIADWFLSQSEMSPKKLQKLSYYALAWGYALLDTSIINDTNFEAWVHGPVSPELYREYRDHGWNDIDKKESNEDKFDEKTLDILRSVWYTYGESSANELEALTHTEAPWMNARKGLEEFENSNKTIDALDMQNYYSSIYIGD